MIKTKKPIGLQTLLLILLMLAAMTILTGGLTSCSGKTDESTDTDTETDRDIYNDNIKKKKDDRTRRARTEKSRDESARQKKPARRFIKKVDNNPQIERTDAAIKIKV